MGQVGQADLPAGTYLRQVMDRLLIDLSWNSSRLEGNTYSLLDTQRLFERGESAEGKAAEETQMILNHKSAIEMLAENADGIGFNRYTICNLHALLSENLLPDPAAGGHIRTRPVGITGTVYRPLEVPQQIEQYFDQILEKAEAIRNPFEQAFFVMVYLPYLQPFEDVNKRISRLAANIPFIRHNLCPLSFVDVDQDDYVRGTLGVYELNRIEYLRDIFTWAYRRSCMRYSAIRQSLGKPDLFRLQYRLQIGQFVRRVVQNGMDKRAAAKWIAMQATGEILREDKHRFVEVVETEISNLHEGNIARYRLRPSEFAAWERSWE
ncbi:MAG TPA: Fic family protein [Proteobacteria bacterium]|nr:Fic family protein [Pseudomonadota bacterium]